MYTWFNFLMQAIHKRRVALAKAQGNMSGAIELLNKYLEMWDGSKMPLSLSHTHSHRKGPHNVSTNLLPITQTPPSPLPKKKKYVANVFYPAFNRFMADHDAWRELAEIYASLQMWDFLRQLFFSQYCRKLVVPGLPPFAFHCLYLCFCNLGTSKLHFAMRS